jgi:hypothetical protein
MANEDNLFDFWEETTTETSGWDNMIDFWTDVWEEKIDTEVTSETTTTEETPTTETEVTITEEDEEEVDLWKLFDDLDSEIETSNEALDNIETAGWDSWEIWTLRDSLKRMEDQIKKLNWNNADLKFRNAELEAYSIEDSDPKIMVIVRNLSKAKDWDDKAKTKTINALKDMIYDLTWEDFDDNKVNQDIDMLTASEMYNTEINPKLKSDKKDEIDWIMV